MLLVVDVMVDGAVLGVVVGAVVVVASVWLGVAIRLVVGGKSVAIVVKTMTTVNMDLWHYNMIILTGL